MSKSANCFIYTLVCWSCMGVLLFAGGCQSGEDGQGKFTEDQMAAFGLAESQNLPEPSGGLVLSVNKETITVDEIVSPLIESLKPMTAGGDFQRFERHAKPIIEKVVLNKTTYILLYQEAKKQAAGNINEDALEKAVQSEVNKFMAKYHGNRAEAEKAIKEIGMDWPRFRDYQKKLLLTEFYISQKLSKDKPVAHSELLAYYEAMKDEYFRWEGQIQFRLIDIVIDKVEPAEFSEAGGQPGYSLLRQDESKKEVALKRAKEVLEKIGAGEDFAKLAQEYSDGHRAKYGGLWTPVTTGSLISPHDILEDQAEKMRPPEVSEPIEADGHIFIMKLEDKKEAGYKPFEEVQQRLEAQIRFQRRNAQLDEMVAKLLKQANVADMETFIDFCVETAYRRSTKIQ